MSSSNGRFRLPGHATTGAAAGISGSSSTPTQPRQRRGRPALPALATQDGTPHPSPLSPHRVSSVMAGAGLGSITPKAATSMSLVGYCRPAAGSRAARSTSGSSRQGPTQRAHRHASPHRLGAAAQHAHSFAATPYSQVHASNGLAAGTSQGDRATPAQRRASPARHGAGLGTPAHPSPLPHRPLHGQQAASSTTAAGLPDRPVFTAALGGTAPGSGTFTRTSTSTTGGVNPHGMRPLSPFGATRRSRSRTRAASPLRSTSRGGRALGSIAAHGAPPPTAERPLERTPSRPRQRTGRSKTPTRSRREAPRSSPVLQLQTAHLPTETAHATTTPRHVTGSLVPALAPPSPSHRAASAAADRPRDPSTTFADHLADSVRRTAEAGVQARSSTSLRATHEQADSARSLTDPTATDSPRSRWRIELDRDASRASREARAAGTSPRRTSPRTTPRQQPPHTHAANIPALKHPLAGTQHAWSEQSAPLEAAQAAAPAASPVASPAASPAASDSAMTSATDAVTREQARVVESGGRGAPAAAPCATGGSEPATTSPSPQATRGARAESPAQQESSSPEHSSKPTSSASGGALEAQAAMPRPGSQRGMGSQGVPQPAPVRPSHQTSAGDDHSAVPFQPRRLAPVRAAPQRPQGGEQRGHGGRQVRQAAQDEAGRSQGPPWAAAFHGGEKVTTNAAAPTKAIKCSITGYPALVSLVPYAPEQPQQVLVSSLTALSTPYRLLHHERALIAAATTYRGASTSSPASQRSGSRARSTAHYGRREETPQTRRGGESGSAGRLGGGSDFSGGTQASHGMMRRYRAQADP